MSLRGLRRVAALLGSTGLSGCALGVLSPDAIGNTSEDSGSSTDTGDDIERCVVSLADVALGDRGFVIDGEGSSHFSGQSVAGVGDLDGDGFDDVVIGARSYLNEACAAYGRPAVVFGKADTEPVELSEVAEGQGGFVLGEIWGWHEEYTGPSGAGWSVSSAGDINGDGIPDLIVGALYEGAYAVFGKADTQPVSLEEVKQGVGGFHVSSAGEPNHPGWMVTSAGDVNGDGVPDLIVGTEGYCYGGGGPTCPGTVRTYVVFGKTDTEPVQPSDLLDGQGGFILELVGESTEAWRVGYPVAGPGDMNGDGLADVVVGHPYGAGGAGCTYVVFGKADTEPVSLADVAEGNGGFVVYGEADIGHSGSAVAAAGDINGDGVPDLLIGAWDSLYTARVYVVFGKSNTDEVSLSEVAEGSGGFVVDGGAGDDLYELSLSPAGDVSGDGVPDFLIGAPYLDVGGVWSVGRTYVVFGKADTDPVSLEDVTQGIGGFILDGTAEWDQSGHSVSHAGDVNGDGAPDLLIGAPHHAASGRTYVVFGPVPDCATGG